MRRSLGLSAGLISLSMLGLFFAAPAPAEDAVQPAQQNDKSATPGQPAPNQPAPSADQQRQGEQAVRSTSGRAGTEEPGSHAPTQNQGSAAAAPAIPGPVLVNGAWNVFGAPKDSQTVPAKFSERNAMLDKLPIMALPLGLTEEQTKAIAAGVRRDNAPVADINPKIAEELPSTVTLRDLPQGVTDIPGVKYVRLADRIVLVRTPNNIVVSEIRN